MDKLRKTWRFLSSMKFAVILLVILAAACVTGSLISQGQDYAYYAAQYSERTAGLILALHLDDAFHSAWFLIINAFLCLNLILCNIVRFPKILAALRKYGDPSEMYSSVSAAGAGNALSAEGIKDPDKVFRELGAGTPRKVTLPDGREGLFGVKMRAGLFGAWVCHLGILLLIAGFSLGQATKEEYTVYGVPGQTKAVGDTGLMLTIDDFTVGLREDDTVSQYTAAFTAADAGGNTRSAEASVNHPASVFGYRVYQNSTGWAAKVSVEKDGKPLQEEVLCAGEYLAVADKPDLVVYLNAFYPDYVFVPGSGPSTASSRIRNPVYLYSVYYQQQMLGMNALPEEETLNIDEYTVRFSEPRGYTLLQIKRDRFAPLAFAGGLIVLAGLFLAFYTLPVRVLAVRGEDGTYTLTGESRKAGRLFADRFGAAAAEQQKGETEG